MQFKEKIAALDRAFARHLPQSRLSPDLQSSKIRRAKTTQALHEFDRSKWRMPCAEEVIRWRVHAVEHLISFGGPISKLQDRAVHSVARLATNPLWNQRITTATHMIRFVDQDGDNVHFFNGDLAGDFAGQLSDGGIRYNRAQLQAENKQPFATIKYSTYLRTRGGNFTGVNFLNHQVFSAICQNKELWAKYVYALQILDLAGFYHQGAHSGWVPQNMAPGFGRAIALGYKGEAWYPPNNSTLGHATILVPISK